MLSPSRAAALAPAGIGLALFVTMVQFRMSDPWGDGVLLVVAAIPAILLLALGFDTARDHGSRAASTVFLVAGLVLTAGTIVWLAQVLAGDDSTGGGGTLTWMLALFTAVAAYCATRTRSGACLLIAALAAVGLVNEGINWIFDTENVDTFRAILTVCFAVLFLAGLTVSGRHGTILVGAAGVTVIVSAYFLSAAFIFSTEGGNLGWGWDLVTLVQGLALLAYAAAELEPGPAYLAFFVPTVFVVSAAATSGGVVVGEPLDDQSHSLVGWPLALGIGTAAVALWGLRRPSDA
jgi:hypothetical protein